jgi:hypothetical protein
MQNRLSAAQTQHNRNLALAVQRTQQQQHRRFQPQQPPQGAQQVSVDGCGDSMNGMNQGYWPQPGGPLAPWTPQGATHMIPQLAPNLGPAANLGLIDINLMRAGALVQMPVAGSITFDFNLSNGSLYWIGGMATGNDFGEVMIESIMIGGIPVNVVRNVDAGFFNVEQCWCEIVIGCVSTLQPASITASQIGNLSNPPFLNIMFVGEFQASTGTCGFPPWQVGYVPASVPTIIPPPLYGTGVPIG